MVAARERRFSPSIAAGRPYMAIPRFRDLIDPRAGSPRPTDGLIRRIEDLGLAYRLGLVASPAIVALGTSHRLPDLSEANVLFLAESNRQLNSFTYRTLGFACLPDDPDAGHEDATVIGTVAELRDRFHDVYTRGWLTDLILAIASTSPLNDKALWGMVASGWASAAGHIARAIEDPHAAIDELGRLLDGDPRTRRSLPAFYIENAEGETRLRHWRGVCCLNYRLVGQEMCEGECPLLPAGRIALRVPAS
jgi:hypothetical protein